jgi:hypothetical protein
MIDLVLSGGSMKHFYQSFCGLMFLLMTTVNAQDSSLLNFPDKDFATPEAAIRHFAESVAKNDVIATLEAFAINEYAEEYDFTAVAERLSAIDIYQGLAPTEYPMYIELNRLSLLSKYAIHIKLFSYSFFSTESLDNPVVPLRNESERIAAFIASANPEQLGNLTVNRIFRIRTVSENILEMWQKQAAPMGAEEITECVVLYELDGTFFLGGFNLLHYDQTWKIYSLSSVIAGMSALGTVVRMTPAEFEAIISRLEENGTWTLEELPLH